MKGEPYARIRKSGRIYIVSIIDGVMRYGQNGVGWATLTRRGAERKARYELARYLKKKDTPDVEYKITRSDL